MTDAQSTSRRLSLSNTRYLACAIFKKSDKDCPTREKTQGMKKAIPCSALGFLSLLQGCMKTNLDDQIKLKFLRISAAAHFLGRILDAAKIHKRVTAKEKETDNEKYAFRCFLLRLGFIGDEFKETRLTLLRNLTGSAAFRTGAKKVFSKEELDAATDDPSVVDAVHTLLHGKKATDDEISE